MLNVYFTLFELMVLVLAIMAVRHAWRCGLHVLWQLVAGMLFGVLLEWATIRQLDAYAYGKFLVMIADVPIVIGVSWGLIIYSAMLFSDATSLPAWARPLLDGLLALNIDLAMDAVAIRLGMWDWGQGPAFEYFGVPWGNFWAWFWVVSSFSAGIRLLARRENWASRWVGPLLSIGVGTLVVLGTNALISFVLLPAGLYEVSVAVVIGGALLLIVALRPKLHVPQGGVVETGTSTALSAGTSTALSAGTSTALSAGVPAAFHLYFLLAGLISGAVFNPPFLLFVSLLMLGVAWVLHQPQRGQRILGISE